MIARISKGDFLKGAVLYNETKVQEGEASTIDIANIKTNSDAEYLESADAIQHMMKICSLKEIKQPVFSCSLNLNQVDLDKLKALRDEKGEEAENDFYRKIASHYMEGMGYGKQPYIVYKHEDIERTHIHIISIRVGTDGKKINDSNEKYRSERVRKEIAEKFGLSEEGERRSEKMSKSEIDSLSGKRSDYISKTGSAVTELAKLDPSDSSNLTKLRHKISNVLKFVDENYKPKNISEYNKILSQFHIQCHKIDVLDKNGNRINGCQFGVVNSKGEFISHLMKGGQINERFTLPKLEAKFALASGMKEDLRKQDAFSKKYITEQIKSILESPREIDLDYFCDTLRVRGVEANLVRNNDEAIVGINFIDNLNGKVFTGSSLGREYTWGSISSKLENHNKKLENGVLEKDAFTKAIKLLSSSYNEVRKETYYLESDLIKDLPKKKEDFTSKLQKELLLTEKQSEKCFDTFCRYKLGHLPSIEAKENSYQQTQIITALMFASKMRNDQQSRVDFLHRMGVSVREKNGLIIYASQRKPDVWISYPHAKDMNNALASEEPITKALKPGGNLEPYGKADRSFVKNVTEGGDGSMVKGGWAPRMLDLLGKETLDTVVNDDVTKHFASAVKPLRNKELKESGKLESEFIRSMEDLRPKMVEEAMRGMGIGRETADAIFGKYKMQQLSVVLPGVEERERKAVVNRMDFSLKFAELIEDPAKRTEFLKRMEISVSKVGGDITLSYDRKPDFKLTLNQIKERTGVEIKPQNLIFADMDGVIPFNKKERNFVRDYISGDNMMDGRNATALSYLSKGDQDRAKAVGVATRVSGILNGINSRTADEMVRALLYRGFVIHPVKEGGATTYKVSRFNNKSPEAMATLPRDLADRLDNSNFSKVYPNIKEQLLAKGMYGTAKLVAVMKITRAGDFNDERLLYDTINDVAKVNRMLADKMQEAATPQKGGGIDYGRVARLVAEYKGESVIKLPPTTAETFIREEKSQMQTIVNELRHGNLDAAIKLMQEDPDQKTQQRHNL